MNRKDTQTVFPSPVIAIHQPNFAPWPGYFHKMALADVFIYLDNVPFSKNSFQNRNKILVNGSVQWLTVPVLSKGSYGAMTCDVRINNSINWRRKHLTTLRCSYAGAHWFDWTFAQIEPVYSEKEDLLFRFCIRINEAIRTMLDITVPTVLASDYPALEGATERLIHLVKLCNGRTYTSGSGGRKYLNEALFRLDNIQLAYLDFDAHPYSQTCAGFVPGLSTLDLLFNLGPDAKHWLRGRGHE